jgi:hypothetical protein
MLYTWICLMVATLAVNTIFVISLLATLTWDQRAMFLFATAALTGAVLFTIRTMTHLNKTN